MNYASQLTFEEEIMANKSFETSFTVEQSQEQVFAAITDPRAWWGEGITGETAKLDGEFILNAQLRFYGE